MKKLTILVDMDDVLENLCEVWVSMINERYHTNLLYKDLKHWNMKENFPNIPIENIVSILDEETLWDKLTPQPESRHYLNKLIEDGHKVVIVTASHFNSLRVKLEHCLFKYFPFLNYKDVIICHQKELVDGDVLIDDKAKNLFSRKRPLNILFSAPHNQIITDHELSNINGVRANNWKEVYELIETLVRSKKDNQ